MGKTYSNAAAFRQALETRLRTIAERRGVQIQGLRLKLAIEFPAMASEAGASSVDMSVAFKILSDYWDSHRLGSP